MNFLNKTIPWYHSEIDLLSGIVAEIDKTDLVVNIRKAVNYILIF